MCDFFIFLEGGPLVEKQRALFGVKDTMVFLFKGSTSESLSALRKVRVKRQHGRGGEGRGKPGLTKATCESVGSGYLTCRAPLSSEKCRVLEFCFARFCTGICVFVIFLCFNIILVLYLYSLDEGSSLPLHLCQCFPQNWTLHSNMGYVFKHPCQYLPVEPNESKAAGAACRSSWLTMS